VRVAGAGAVGTKIVGAESNVPVTLTPTVDVVVTCGPGFDDAELEPDAELESDAVLGLEPDPDPHALSPIARTGTSRTMAARRREPNGTTTPLVIDFYRKTVGA
jgi:hypothetical protein